MTIQKTIERFSGKNVLLVEDYFINQEILQDMLEVMDCSVDIAENGSEALQKYDNKAYDLILMDIQLPDMDGYEITKEIRKKEQSAGKKRTAIIAVTANAMAGDREKSLTAGMDDYIAKPVELTELEGLIKKYLPS